MVFCRTSRAQGLSRPPLCTVTVQTTVVLGDCPDHHRAQGLSRPLSCSGTIPITVVLGDCPDHSPNIARRQVSLARCDLYSHTVERRLFRPCYKAATSPSSKLGDYIGRMHLSVQFVSPVQRLGSQLNRELFFRPWHHVPTSPTTRLGD